jgi:hypothetical protein
VNVAFSALLVFLLLLPGFLFRTYFKRAEKVVLDIKPFGQAAIDAFLTAIVIDLVWYWTSHLVTGTRVDFRALFTLIAGEKSAELESAIAELAADPWRPGIFFGSLYAFAIACAFGLRYVVTRWRLDRRGAPLANFLRFDTPWYYLFTGYDRLTAPNGVAIGAVVSLGGTAYLYTGVLVEYFLDDQGQLNRLVLTSAARRPLSEDALQTSDPLSSPWLEVEGSAGEGAPPGLAEERFYPIEGDYFVLRYSEVLTLNVRYLDLSD